MTSPFLTAEWRHLVLLSFEVDPAALRPLVPAGTELDGWQGRTLASVVGLLFLQTRVLGLSIPFHRDFEEVNLRFYVRRRTGTGWRRGVVFVKELVPRTAIALTARTIYGENYAALPMSHRIELDDGGAVRRVSYAWSFAGRENRLSIEVQGPAREIEPESEEEFFAHHHWGYVRRRDGSTLEYEVEHPRWRVWRAHAAALDCDAARLYGPGFAACLTGAPASALLAEGSEVAVHQGVLLPAERG
jgi:uncharacterized protein YqjF (DUF2071 family)